MKLDPMEKANLVLAIAVTIALGIVLLLLGGCATIADPPMPVGPVTSQQVLDYQAALIRAGEARDAQRVTRARWAVWIGTIADAGSTLYAVEQPGLEEGNPLLPDPATQPAFFIGMQLAVGYGADRLARNGYVREAWMYGIL